MLVDTNRAVYSNSVAEGLNSKIMSIKRKACGYSNKDHFKTAIYFSVVGSICTRGQFEHVAHRVSGRTIYFFCSGLDLYPKSV